MTRRHGPLAGLLAVLVATSAGAQGEVGERLQRERTRLGEVRDRYESVQRQIQVLTSRRQVLETQLAANRRDQGQLEVQIRQLRLESEAASRAVVQAGAELQVAETEFAGYLRDFEARLVHIYKRGTGSTLGTLIHSRSLDDLVARARYSRFLQEDAVQLGSLQASRDRISLRKTRLETASADARRLQSELSAREKSLSDNIREASELLEQLRRERDHELEKAGKLREASKILETKLSNLAKAAQVLAREEPVGRPAARAVERGQLRWPLDGDITILKPFGAATNQAGTPEFNSGIDLRIDGPAEVRASAAGRVLFQGVFSPVYGQVVMVDHGGSPANLISLYGNLDTILTTVNQEVRAGDVLGLVGASPDPGVAVSALHFEVRQGTEAQDPRAWLSRR